MLHVIGIGSPFGGDDLGWRIVEQLRDSSRLTPYAPQLSFEVSDRPGASLLALMAGCEAVVLIDAMLSGAVPGMVRLLEGDEIGAMPGLLSSHGFGVADTLALGGVLGQLPPRLWLLGVEVSSAQAAPGLAQPLFEEAISKIESALMRLANLKNCEQGLKMPS